MPPKYVSQPGEGIELLHTPHCETWRATKNNLQEALDSLEITEDIHEVEVATIEQAKEYNFFASPTIHIRGVDVDPHARTVRKIGLGENRPYFFKKIAYPTPPTEMIQEALQELYLN